MALGFRVGAEDAEHPVRERVPRARTSSGPSAPTRRPRAPRLRIPARSLPASGSDQPWHQMSVPDAMRGSSSAFCSSVPNSMIVGPRRKTPFWFTRPGAPARQYSSSKMSHCTRSAPRPPYSTGHDTAAQPPSYNVRSHCRCCSKPAAVSIEASGSRGTLTSSHVRRLAPEGVLLGGVPEVHLRWTLGEPIGHRQVPRRPPA